MEAPASGPSGEHVPRLDRAFHRAGERNVFVVRFCTWLDVRMGRGPVCDCLDRYDVKHFQSRPAESSAGHTFVQMANGNDIFAGTATLAIPLCGRIWIAHGGLSRGRQ